MKNKKILTIIVAIVISLFVLGIVKDQLIKGVVAVVATNVLGAPVEIGKVSNNKTQIRISARKYLLPKPEIASGVLYRIKDKLR